MRFILTLALMLMVQSLDNGLGLVPPMAWNSWNKFACKINESLIRETADAIVEKGFLQAGYSYLNIDDCWASKRNSSRFIQPDPKTFPSGIGQLSNYIHSKGLKFGIYSDAGLKTCAGRPGSLFHEKEDAQSYAEWKVDYLKYDNCFSDEVIMTKTRYQRMRDALNATGRPIYFSMCEWGIREPWKWANAYANSWRILPDIKVDWPWIETIIEQLLRISHLGRPGGWNDPDMLEVGIGNLSEEEEKTHFAIWAITKSPLIIGCDINNLRESSRKILLNREIIALNQDRLGVPGKLLLPYENDKLRVVYMPLDNTDLAVLLYNRSNKPIVGGFIYRKVGWPFRAAEIRDLYLQQEIGPYDYEYYTVIPARGVKVFRLRKPASTPSLPIQAEQ